MKYFAILKDSLREAIDSKVLMVLIAMSTVTIAIVAGFSFKPLSADVALGMFFSTSFDAPPIYQAINHKSEKLLARDPNLFDAARKMPSRVPFRLEAVELVHGEADSPESEYAMIVSQGNWRHGDPPPGKSNDLNAPLGVLREVFQDAEDLGFVRVGSVEYVQNAERGQRKLYRVQLQGTPSTHRIWATQVSVFSFPVAIWTAPLGYRIYLLSQLVLSFGEWIAVLAGIIITSFFVPNMLRKGTVDLLLVKPIQRWLLLVYKFVGGLAFIFLSTTYAIGGIWLVLGICSGLWAHGIFLLILSITFFFAILYSVSVLVAVLTRSTVTAIMLTLIVWVVFFAIGTAHNGLEMIGRVENEMAKYGNTKPPEERWGDSTTAKVIAGLHLVTPRTADLSELNDTIVCTSFMTGNLADMNKFDSSNRNWWESLFVSSAWIVGLLGLSCLRFTFTDY